MSQFLPGTFALIHASLTRVRWVHETSAIGLAVLAIAVAACGEDGGAGVGDAIQVPWLEARAAAGGRALNLGYVNDPCTRARRALVEEDEESVTITLLDPERDPDEVCIQLAKPGCARVPLADPLAGRRVVDGAERQPGRGQEIGDTSFRRFRPCRPVPVER